MTPAAYAQELLGSVALGVFVLSAAGGVRIAADLIRHRSAQPQASGVRTAGAAAPASPAAEEPPPMNPLSFLNQNVLVPIEHDIEAFFTSSDPNAVAAKTAVVAVGTAGIKAVDPIFVAAETGLETVINTALSSLGVIGQTAEIPVDLFYQLLAKALQTKIDAKLTTASADLAAATGTTTAADTGGDGYSAPKTS